MSNAYNVEEAGEVQLLEPTQADFYQMQLRDMSTFALRGAGAETGIDTTASQVFLDTGGNTAPQYASTLVWQSPYEASAAHFAVLPPQDARRKYFGTARQVEGHPSKVFVEGVDLHPVGSRYTSLLVDYDLPVDPAQRIPQAIGAFVQTLRERPFRRSAENATGASGLDADVHARLGSAALTFWNTLAPSPDVWAERIDDYSAFDLANLIINEELKEHSSGDLVNPHGDVVVPYRDNDGNVTGFVREEQANGTITAMIRNDTTLFADRIDLIQIPQSFLGEDDTMVNHYIISSERVDAGACILSAKLVSSADDVRNLIRRIQRSSRPIERLDDQSLRVVVKELQGELGRLIGGHETAQLRAA